MVGLKIKQINQSLALEHEKENFIQTMDNFFSSIDLSENQTRGRPKTNLIDILKSLCLMSYTQMSYRRIQSELSIFKKIPRSTLSNYANKDSLKHLLEKLIQMSAMFFLDEDYLILDSTWFGQRMYTGGYRKVYNKSYSMSKVRKLHIGCLRDSKIIAYAKCTKGTINDSPLFETIVKQVINNGFKIKTLIADAGYSSKNNYAICRDLKIMNIFINFKKNASVKRSKSNLWREQLLLYRNNRDIWNETYRFRVIVESIFSVIKRKHLNYLRSKNDISRDIELLLKCLVYNLTIIGKFHTPEES